MFVAKATPKSVFVVIHMDVVLTVVKKIVSNFYFVVNWSLAMDQSKCGCVRWTIRLENTWFVPRSSAIIKSVCELGVSQTMQYIVQAGQHGLGDGSPLYNDVDHSKPKSMQLDAIGCCCCQALKVGQKEHLPLPLVQARRPNLDLA